MKHSKTPWTFEPASQTIYAKDMDTEIAKYFYSGEDETNAKHIVKCVNYFDELKKFVIRVSKNKGCDQTGLDLRCEAKQLLEKLEREENDQ